MTFHRRKVTKVRRGLRTPDPISPAAVRHRRAGRNVSCCRLGEFLRGCRCAARIMQLREFDGSCRRRNAGKWPHRVRTLFDGLWSTQPGILSTPCHSERSEESVSPVGERILRPVPGLRMTGRGHTGPGKRDGRKPFGSMVCRDAGQQRLLCQKATGAHAGSHCGHCWHQVRRFGNRIPATA